MFSCKYWLEKKVIGNPAVLERLKRTYPPGTRVVLVKMDDPYRKMYPGNKGSVINVDSVGTIHVASDCGSFLGVVFGEDECKKIEE